MKKQWKNGGGTPRLTEWSSVGAARNFWFSPLISTVFFQRNVSAPWILCKGAKMLLKIPIPCYNNVNWINHFSVYSCGKRRSISSIGRKTGLLMKCRHCYNAYFRWNAVALQRKVQGFRAVLPKILAHEQRHLALEALAFKAFGFVQYAL